MSKPVILCVDDEVLVLDSLKRQLKKEFRDAYLYELAENAEEAIEIIEELEEEGINIQIIISDWLMPGLKGDEFLAIVHQKFPKIIKILLTGHVDEEAVKRAQVQANLHCCLYKPWNRQELITIIKSGLEKYQS